MSNPMIQLAKVSPPFFKTAPTKESSLVAAENGCDVSGRRDASSSSLSNSIESLSNSIESLRTIFWALMSNAMILPCGHTFGAGGMEQVKQMVWTFPHTDGPAAALIMGQGKSQAHSSSNT
ncbi:hypothetical protein DY000_02046466 [Brassica cretica]|uniref:MEKHLA domain-containing protein n=1 Tax=Brassica cretica TaxID=69181 RepID=A0ABQ7F413_BRACR|nr:hypothetical protein DY000_02046466 [Brassica cretica]